MVNTYKQIFEAKLLDERYLTFSLSKRDFPTVQVMLTDLTDLKRFHTTIVRGTRFDWAFELSFGLVHFHTAHTSTDHEENKHEEEENPAQHWPGPKT